MIVAAVLMVFVWFVGIPMGVLLAMEGHHRNVWRRVRIDEVPVPVGTGAFRKGVACDRIESVVQDRAPLGVRVTALSCFVAAQVAMPMVPLGLFPVIFMLQEHAQTDSWWPLELWVLGLALAVWVAASLFRLGFVLLRDVLEVPGARLRSTARVVVPVDVLITLGACWVHSVRGVEFCETSLLLYVLVSLLHLGVVAWAVRRQRYLAGA